MPANASMALMSWAILRPPSQAGKGTNTERINPQTLDPYPSDAVADQIDATDAPEGREMEPFIPRRNRNKRTRNRTKFQD